MVRKYISGVGSTLLSYMCHIGITTWAYLYVGTIMLVRGSTSLPNVIKVQQFFLLQNDKLVFPIFFSSIPD